MKHQYQLLIALICCFVLSLFYAWHRFPRQQAADVPKPLPGRANSHEARISSTNDGQNIILSLPEPPQMALAIKRDLFRPLTDTINHSKRGKKEAPAVPPPPPPPTKGELARRELQQYKIMGFLKLTGQHVAFISRGNNMVVIREGSSLIPGYYVTGINGYRLMMRAEDGDELLLERR